ncbi:MAG TPA: hydroxyisourate hydrolase [Vicinamibacterales bacterium]|nr:hydroxyisourate hydrolase [Vicinamibacterales bacterium]
MTISTHVLDTSLGRPAGGVAVALMKQQGAVWIEVFTGATDADGRVPPLRDVATATGSWRLTFDAGAYFARRGVESFYTVIAIDFVVRSPDAHYHVPLLISPFGYSTYRGS